MWINKIFQLLRRSHPAPTPVLRERDGSPVAPSPEPTVTMGHIDQLDLQAAIIHHLQWCVVFNDHLGHINHIGAPPAQPLPNADQSELGQWLRHCASRAPGPHPVFEELQREHERFHSLANEALHLATNDRMDLASTLLNTDFERSRARVLALLREMQKG